MAHSFIELDKVVIHVISWLVFCDLVFILLALWWICGFPGGSDVKASACYEGDHGSTPGSRRSPGEGNGNPLQYSCLENPMDGGAWWATVYRVKKSQTRLSDLTFTFTFLMGKDKKHMEASWWERLRGKLSLVLMGGAMLSESLIQFSVGGRGCVTPCCLTSGQTIVEVLKIMVTSFKKVPCMHCCTQCPRTCRRPPSTHTSSGDSWILTGKSGSISCGVTAPSSWALVCTRFCLCPPRVCFPSPV